MGANFVRPGEEADPSFLPRALPWVGDHGGPDRIRRTITRSG